MADKDTNINRLIRNSAEVITEEELRARLSSGEQLTHYIGFEISGYVHIGQGILSALVMKDLTNLGVKCTVWLADWHTAINDKLDGTRETAAKIGKGYFTEAIKACFLAVGGNPNKLEFRLASEWYAKDWAQYFATIVRISQKTTDARLKRSISIMGREEGENVEAATLIYPLMQVADILYQKIDIVHAAMDQRKAHAMLLNVASKVAPDQPKPIAIHHPLVFSLKGPAKMSKSNPDAAIFIHDSEEDIQRKIKNAFCKEKDIKTSPIMNWTKHILFWDRAKPFNIDRRQEHGGGVEFTDFASLEKAYAAGEVHPLDLKTAVAKELIALLQPIRDHFAKADIAALKTELDKVLLKR